MYEEYEIPLRGGRLCWRSEYDDTCRLHCEDAQGRLLALESDACGCHWMVDGQAGRGEMAMDERGHFTTSPTALAWSRDYPAQGFRLSQHWQKTDEETVRFTCRLEALRPIAQPHLSYGLQYLVPPHFSRFAFAYSMTQCGYTFPAPMQTLWMISLPPEAPCGKNPPCPVLPFDGCQGLVAENPDPATLEFHLRLPPGYVAPTRKQYGLQPGQAVELRGAICLRPGAFYDHAEANLALTGQEVLPPRHSYERYIELALENFLDERKYAASGAGILYHSAVDGDVTHPRFQYWTEGPSWGGACDAENCFNLVRCAHRYPERAGELLGHARKMLLGWLDNPRFRVPSQIYEQVPGDMADVYVTTGWFPDCIWTIAQADLILRLADLHQETQWPECLPEARKIAAWMERHIDAAGCIPTMWQFPVVYPPELGEGWRPRFSRCTRTDRRARVLAGSQGPSACFLAVALRHLARAETMAGAAGQADRWNALAHRLVLAVLPLLQEPLSHFGNGECDYTVYRSESIDPTGIAYILRGLAEEYEATQNTAIPPLLERYMDIFSAFSVHWDCQENRLRPLEKTSLPPYGTDIRLAGGMTHGNWMPVARRGFGGRFNLLMNRNEIAEGMLCAWRITHRRRDREMLLAFANWQTYFQFLEEVPGSPVTTRGSCPQNHFWTTDCGNWNNDYALTAFKWTETLSLLLEADLTVP